MKKLSYVLGLVAMVVMMTMTSCGSDSKGSGKDNDKDISEDVQKMCDALDAIALDFENADSDQECTNIMNNIGDYEPDVDKSTELTDDDREALKASLMTLSKAMIHKAQELSPEYVSDTMVEETINEFEKRVDELISESETLGDFIRNMDRHFF